MLTLLRDFLKVLGSALVANGVINTTDWTTWSGLAIMIAPIGWGLYEKTKARMIAKVDAMPEVKGVVTNDTSEGRALAREVPSKTVVPAGTLAAAEISK